MQHDDGTRDCPGCIAADRYPNRVRGDTTLCFRCEQTVHNDVMAGLAEMQPWLRRQLAFTDFLIEHQR